MSRDTLLADSQPNPAGYRDIAIDQALAHLGEVHLVDVREPDEYVGPLGHVPGAELVPLGTVTSVATGWSKDALRIMVCRSGGRSGRAAGALAQLGFTNVYNLAGGMLAWEQTGLPRSAHSTPFEEVATELRLAVIAMTGTDPGPAADRATLTRGIDGLAASPTLPADAATAWKQRLQERLRSVG